MQYLAICSIKAGTPKKNVISLIRTEAIAAWKLYESDIVRSIWFKADLSGAVMMMEADNIAEIERALDTLPMVHDGILVPQIEPLKPYIAFGKLFPKPTETNGPSKAEVNGSIKGKGAKGAANGTVHAQAVSASSKSH
jgi:hypothetical protein